MNRVVLVYASLGVLLLATACEDPSRLTGSFGGAGGDPGEQGGGPADPDQPGNCAEGAPHPGFAGHDFVSDRKPGALGDDRRRVKPFSALSSEFQRALGAVPKDLQTSVAAFGDTPARWFSEPQAGAVSLFTTYNLAFTACYDANVPLDCAGLQRKIWQRTPTPEETKACTDFIAGLTEPDARRKAAHACASIMSSAGFTTY